MLSLLLLLNDLAMQFPAVALAFYSCLLVPIITVNVLVFICFIFILRFLLSPIVLP